MYCFITYWPTDKSDILRLYKLIKMNTLQKKALILDENLKSLFFLIPLFMSKRQ